MIAMEWCRGAASSLAERCDLSLGASLVEPVVACTVDAPMIMEKLDLRPAAERPPTATDLERAGGEALAIVSLLEELLGGRDDVMETARSKVCIARL